MRTSATNRKLRVLLTAIADETLVPRPEFQRRLVWTNKDKLSFIQTVLEGYPFPEIYIAAGSVDADTGKGSEMLVDGQQRVTTLNQYFRNSPELRLDKDTPAYGSLSPETKLAFLEYEVVVRDLGQMNLENIKRVFQRINATNYSLNAMEIHNARFDGDFKKTAELISELEFFDRHNVFSAADIRRMQDVRFCLTLLVTVMSTYFTRDEAIEEYLEKYNDEFEQAESIKADFVKTLEFINECKIASNLRVWKKADLFTLIVEIYKAIIKRKVTLDAAHVGKALTSFYLLVDVMGETDPKSDQGKYYKAALQGSNDRGNRVTRGDVIQRILEGSHSQRDLRIGA